MHKDMSGKIRTRQKNMDGNISASIETAIHNNDAADFVLQSKLDSLPVEDTVSAEAWQASTDDDDNDESPSEPLIITLPTTDPGLIFLFFSLTDLSFTLHFCKPISF